MIYDTFYINNLKEDFDHVEQIINYDFRNRWKRIKIEQGLQGTF